MASSWERLGELGTVGQLVGVDAVRLIGMIVQAANTARMHKNNCRQFAQHLKLIGNLLEQLKISELKKYPETREPLEHLEDALRRSYVLVNSCQDRSFLYLLAMGWNIVYQFRKAQTEIDRYLRIIPLITLVSNARIRERIEDIEKDQREYTLSEDERKAQDAVLSRDPSQNDALVLKKTLSCSYPDLPFEKALRKESEKLQLELRRSQTNLDVSQCEVIQHLIGVAETVASSLPEKNSPKLEENRQEYSDHKRGSTAAESSKEALSRGEWSSDLLGCCSEPYLCLRTFFFPCGTLSKIASVAKSRPISSAEVCNDLMAYSLVLSCCCYTCCIRRSLRRLLKIEVLESFIFRVLFFGPFHLVSLSSGRVPGRLSLSSDVLLLRSRTRVAGSGEARNPWAGEDEDQSAAASVHAVITLSWALVAMFVFSSAQFGERSL